MSDEENHDIPMAECGACGAIVPLDSKSCPSCDVSFDGISDEELGECGSCGAIIPVDSESCAKCGAFFVAIDTPEEESIDDSESDIEISTSEALEVLDSMIDDINTSTKEDEDSEGATCHDPNLIFEALKLIVEIPEYLDFIEENDPEYFTSIKSCLEAVWDSLGIHLKLLDSGWIGWARGCGAGGRRFHGVMVGAANIFCFWETLGALPGCS